MVRYPSISYDFIVTIPNSLFITHYIDAFIDILIMDSEQTLKTKLTIINARQ
jgi:hypothetical protein